MLFSQGIYELLEECPISLISFRPLTRRPRLLLPFVGRGDELEIDGGARIVDLPQLNLHAKELRILTRAMVEQIQGFQVFIPELFGNPDYHMSVKSSRIGEQLAEVSVIGGFELIFNNDRAATPRVTRQDIQRIATHRGFTRFQFQVQPQGFAKL